MTSGRVLALALPLLLASLLGCQSAPGPEPLRDEVYARRGELELLADVHRPASAAPAPAVVIVHGGSWARGTRRRMERVARAVAAHGFVAVNVEYRLAPEHPYPAPVTDVLAAVAWVRRNAGRLGVTPGRIGLWGYSAGGHLSALAASRPEELDPADGEDARVQACVLGSSPSDLRRFGEARAVARLVGGPPLELPLIVRAASPLFAVHAESPPTFLYHGRDDWIVGVDHSQDLRDALAAEEVPVRLLETPRGHLTQLICPGNVLPEALAFLDEHLGAPEVASAGRP